MTADYPSRGRWLQMLQECQPIEGTAVHSCSESGWNVALDVCATHGAQTPRCDDVSGTALAGPLQVHYIIESGCCSLSDCRATHCCSHMFFIPALQALRKKPSLAPLFWAFAGFSAGLGLLQDNSGAFRMVLHTVQASPHLKADTPRALLNSESAGVSTTQHPP